MSEEGKKEEEDVTGVFLKFLKNTWCTMQNPYDTISELVMVRRGGMSPTPTRTKPLNGYV